MPVAIKLSKGLVDDAKIVALAKHRTVPKQIEYWARIGKAVLDNPELPLRLIQDAMRGLDEAKTGKVAEYKLDH
ncbi:ParD-like antitoxin of type II bacterial toxin-antitoxin system [Comamonadaceae bacterium]